MEDFLHTDPEQLLAEHFHLLFSDFAALASGPTKNKLEWVSEIDSALCAASHVARGSQHVQCGPSTVWATSLGTNGVQVSPGG
jgi:hypothetical protein